MRRPVALLLFAALAAAGVAGCRSSSCSRVESELRAREDDVRTLKEEVGRLGCTNEALSRELAAHRGDPGPDGHYHLPSEPYPMRSLVVGRQTGGRYNEVCGGDDGLTVIVEPRDCDEQTIKAPGAMVIDVIETPREGESRLLRRYQFEPDQVRVTWQSGLFSTGYRLSLDFDRWPTTDRLRVVAYFRMRNGRVFEAGKDLMIRLPPERLRQPLNATPTPAPTPPSGPPIIIEQPPRTPAAPERPEPPPQPMPPEQTLPAPTPVPETPPPGKQPPEKPQIRDEGPILTRIKGKGPAAVEMFRPIPLLEE